MRTTRTGTMKEGGEGPPPPPDMPSTCLDNSRRYSNANTTPAPRLAPVSRPFHAYAPTVSVTPTAAVARNRRFFSSLYSSSYACLFSSRSTAEASVAAFSDSSDMVPPCENRLAFSHSDCHRFFSPRVGAYFQPRRLYWLSLVNTDFMASRDSNTLFSASLGKFLSLLSSRLVSSMFSSWVRPRFRKPLGPRAAFSACSFLRSFTRSSRSISSCQFAFQM
mmetsp:Transcript_12561/g.21256  ORF Transcript_12561/g.21256 Transcript_12561/m.21256 type:complete len:220 (-) Transcript_12561:280-939(-)